MGDVKAWHDDLQRLLNAHPVPKRFTLAAHPPPAVRVRLVWERDGIEHLDTIATAWTRELVLVQVRDSRLQTTGAWVAAEDVERVSQADSSSRG